MHFPQLFYSIWACTQKLVIERLGEAESGMYPRHLCYTEWINRDRSSTFEQSMDRDPWLPVTVLPGPEPLIWRCSPTVTFGPKATCLALFGLEPPPIAGRVLLRRRSCLYLNIISSYNMGWARAYIHIYKIMGNS